MLPLKKPSRCIQPVSESMPHSWWFEHSTEQPGRTPIPNIHDLGKFGLLVQSNKCLFDRLQTCDPVGRPSRGQLEKRRGEAEYLGSGADSKCSHALGLLQCNDE